MEDEGGGGARCVIGVMGGDDLQWRGRLLIGDGRSPKEMKKRTEDEENRRSRRECLDQRKQSVCCVNGDQRPVTPSSKHQKKDDEETQKWHPKRVKDEERQKERREVGEGGGDHGNQGALGFLNKPFSLGRTDRDRTGAGECLHASRPSLRTLNTSVPAGDEVIKHWEGDGHWLRQSLGRAMGRRWCCTPLARPLPPPDLRRWLPQAKPLCRPGTADCRAMAAPRPHAGTSVNFSRNAAKRVWNLILHPSPGIPCCPQFPSIFFTATVSSRRCAQAARHTLRPDHGVKPWALFSTFQNPISLQSHQFRLMVQSNFPQSNLGPVAPAPNTAKKPHKRASGAWPPSIPIDPMVHGCIENRYRVTNAISLIPPRPLGCRRSDAHHAPLLLTTGPLLPNIPSPTKRAASLLLTSADPFPSHPPDTPSPSSTSGFRVGLPRIHVPEVKVAVDLGVVHLSQQVPNVPLDLVYRPSHDAAEHVQHVP